MTKIRLKINLKFKVIIFIINRVNGRAVKGSPEKPMKSKMEKIWEEPMRL